MYAEVKSLSHITVARVFCPQGGGNAVRAPVGARPRARRGGSARLPRGAAAASTGAPPPNLVRESWAGVRRFSHLSLFLIASRMVIPKILVLTFESPRFISSAADSARTDSPLSPRLSTICFQNSFQIFSNPAPSCAGLSGHLLKDHPSDCSASRSITMTFYS